MSSPASSIGRRLATVLVAVGVATTSMIAPATAAPSSPRQSPDFVADQPTSSDEHPTHAAADPYTVTDTEMRRMRAEVQFEVFAAGVELVFADRETDAAAQAKSEARVAHKGALWAEAQIETALTQNVIDGFVDDVDVKRTFGPSLDTIAGASRSSATTDAILSEREAAAISLEEAELQMDEAQERATAARRRMDVSRFGYNEAKAHLVTFERHAEMVSGLAAAADARAAARSDEVALRAVAGNIVVAAELEPVIDLLIADARADGIDLGGGGHRTFEEQIATRLANCSNTRRPGAPVTPATPPGDETPAAEPPADGPALEAPPVTAAPSPAEAAPDTPDVEGGAATPGTDAISGEPTPAPAPPPLDLDWIIYGAPASSCSPPTAIPGTSQHQLGLAVDFTLNGSILNSSSPGFLWLQEHAAEYGLINLPSEPWHWSTTGR